MNRREMLTMTSVTAAAGILLFERAASAAEHRLGRTHGRLREDLPRVRQDVPRNGASSPVVQTDRFEIGGHALVFALETCGNRCGRAASNLL